MKAILAVSMALCACGSTTPTGLTRSEDPKRPDAAVVVLHDASVGDATVAVPHDAGVLDVFVPLPEASTDAQATWVDECGNMRPDANANVVVSFTPGDNAGFGKANLPCVVLGGPKGGGAGGGSTDVVSLGKGGTIVLAFDDVELVDEPGPDLVVYENAFTGFVEPGFVAVSADGETWSEWPCDCAGVHADGDAFDLADLGVTSVRFVRVRDAERGTYTGISGGFDLDAITAVHSRPR